MFSWAQSYFGRPEADHVCDQESEHPPRPLPTPLLVKWGTRHVVIRRQTDYIVCFLGFHVIQVGIYLD